ncbi:hypothetical protein E5D57_001372 [Metarhizium anisopliae]|nr:hypothetical protein E5D57_001372 [Metarhizium anisopliae]
MSWGQSLASKKTKQCLVDDITLVCTASRRTLRLFSQIKNAERVKEKLLVALKFGHETSDEDGCSRYIAMNGNSTNRAPQTYQSQTGYTRLWAVIRTLSLGRDWADAIIDTLERLEALVPGMSCHVADRSILRGPAAKPGQKQKRIGKKHPRRQVFALTID